MAGGWPLARIATWAAIVVALLVVLFPLTWMLITACTEYEPGPGLGRRWPTR